MVNLALMFLLLLHLCNNNVIVDTVVFSFCAPAN